METAENEKEHAKRFYKLLLDGFKDELPTVVEIKDAAYPVAQGTTLDNLIAAAEGEKEEWRVIYPEFAKVAEKEGFAEIAAAFRMISTVEERHEIRYIKLANNIKEDRVFKRNEKVLWKCSNCGYVHEGNDAPNICPACQHPKNFFELYVEAY